MGQSRATTSGTALLSFTYCLAKIYEEERSKCWGRAGFHPTLARASELPILKSGRSATQRSLWPYSHTLPDCLTSLAPTPRGARQRAAALASVFPSLNPGLFAPKRRHFYGGPARHPPFQTHPKGARRPGSHLGPASPHLLAFALTSTGRPTYKLW